MKNIDSVVVVAVAAIGEFGVRVDHEPAVALELASEDRILKAEVVDGGKELAVAVANTRRISQTGDSSPITWVWVASAKGVDGDTTRAVVGNGSSSSWEEVPIALAAEYSKERSRCCRGVRDKLDVPRRYGRRAGHQGRVLDPIEYEAVMCIANMVWSDHTAPADIKGSDCRDRRAVH